MPTWDVRFLTAPNHRITLVQKKNARGTMPKLLSQDQVAFYRDRGYHFPVDVLSRVEVAEFRRKL
jgi:hypothetical protein